MAKKEMLLLNRDTETLDLVWVDLSKVVSDLNIGHDGRSFAKINGVPFEIDSVSRTRLIRKLNARTKGKQSE